MNARAGAAVGFDEWAAAAPGRACEFCGGSLDGFRRGTRYCSGASRAEASRVRRLLSGVPADCYATLADRMEAYGRPRRKRTDKAA